MTSLVLGVNDLSYDDKYGTTTGAVAEILEDKYGVMGKFFELHQDEIVELICTDISRAIENEAEGLPVPENMFARTAQKTEKLFEKCLDSKELDYKIDGVPTEAAQKGVSKRFKAKKKKGVSRPSFIDTGLYENSFTAWIED